MALVVALAALLAGAGAGTAATTTAAASGSPYCGITWGSAGKSAGTPSGAPLVDVRTGRHDCFDRVVFEFAGPVTGHTVGERVASPVIVAGTADVFEATVTVRVLDAAGRTVATTFTCGSGCRGDYRVSVAYRLQREQAGTIEAYEVSAADGTRRHVVSVPVTLAPTRR